MRPEDVREHVVKQPFEPFRIFMSDGAIFDVKHPDLCIIGRSALQVVIPDRKNPWMYDRLAHCALIHVTRIEPINGHARPKRSRKRRSPNE